MKERTIHPLRQERLRKGWTQQQLADFAQVALSSIERAEQGKTLRVDICQRICNALDKETPEDLGLQCYGGHTTGASAQATNSIVQPPITIDTTSNNFFLTTPFQPSDDKDILDQLITTVKRPQIDEQTLTNLEMIVKNQWQLYAGLENSVQYREDLLHGLSGYLQTITRLIANLQPTHIHNHLATMACETTQLIGEIFFDLKDSDTAERYYNTSIAIARETQDDVSLAVTLGRKSFIPIYSTNAQKALPLLQEAYTKLKNENSSIIRAWLLAREAEVHAHLQDANACFKALEKAEFYLERAKPGEAPSYAFTGEAIHIHFTRSMLLGYKGACYTHLNMPAEAQTALHEDMSSIDPTRNIHNAIVLIDLARTYIQQGEIGEACKYAQKALSIMIQLKSARVFQRILDFRKELEVWKDTEEVRALDTQIIMVPYLTI